MVLSPQAISAFHRQGFLVIEKHLTKETCNRLMGAIGNVLRSFDLAESRTIFSTKEQTRVSNDYFLESGDKIRFFWEEDAFDDQGNLKQDPLLCINKVGHGLHDLHPDFQAVTYHRQNGIIAQQLGLSYPLAAQSMYIFKQPRIGGLVDAHQDGTFLYTRPQSVLGFWWALEDCTLDNGCLWAIPGSQQQGVNRRFRRTADGKGTEFDPPEPVEWDLSGAQPLEVPAGTLVLLHHSLVHFSHPNKSNASRHAYSVHVIDGAPGVEYPADNWLQRSPSMPFQSLV